MLPSNCTRASRYISCPDLLSAHGSQIQRVRLVLEKDLEDEVDRLAVRPVGVQRIVVVEQDTPGHLAVEGITVGHNLGQTAGNVDVDSLNCEVF